MRRVIRSPLTWAVVAEVVVVGSLLFVAYGAVRGAGRPGVAVPAVGGDVAGDLAADADVGALDRGLDGRRPLDRDVAAHLQVAFDVPGDLEVALDLEPPLQDVARAETDDVGAAVLGRRGLNRGLFSLSHE